MSDNVIPIKLANGTTTEWSTANPVLRKGELGVDLTLKRMKVGDGVTAWNALGFVDDAGFAAAAQAVLAAGQAEAARIASENVAAGFMPVTWWTFQTLFRSTSPATQIQWLENIGFVAWNATAGEWQKGGDGSALTFGEGLLPSWFTVEDEGFLAAEYLDLVAVKSATLADNKILSLSEAVTEFSGTAISGSTYEFPLASVPGWTGSAFTVFSDHEDTARLSSTEYLCTLSDGTNSNRVHWGNSTANANQDVWVYAFSGGANVASMFSSGNVADGPCKSAYAIALNDGQLVVNGSSVTTDAALTLPVGLDQVVINGNAIGAVQPWTGNHMTAIFPRRISGADLISRTA